jgi:hypothetical protein
MLAYSESKEAKYDGKVHFKPHSLRHVATSLNALKYSSLNDVLRAGAWTFPDMFLSYYAQDFSVDSISELSHLAGFVAAGAYI